MSLKILYNRNRRRTMLTLVYAFYTMSLHRAVVRRTRQKAQRPVMSLYEFD